MSLLASTSALMRSDNLKTRDVAQRWAVLAEQRLSYLTELFDSGRWRRFHNEADFLDNIQEAKSAVERWQAMAKGEFVVPVIRDVPIVRDVAARDVPVRNVPVIREAPVVPPIIAAIMEDIAAQPQHEAEIVSFEDYAAPREAARLLAHLGAVDDAPVVVEEQTSEVALAPTPLDLFDRDAIIERYPMLRAAM